MIKAIITDIEGTTTSLAFVKEVLFPYARQHIADFVQMHRDDADVKQQLAEVSAIVGHDLDDDEIIKTLQQWIDADKKITPLKVLQGMLWQHGYQTGAYRGHIYEDAANKLQEWHRNGVKLYVFSSGSVQAQQLLFGFSDSGDLKPFFSGYFDTRIGSKSEVTAYQKIVDDVGLKASECLFLSDIEAELDAAAMAGMKTIQLVRDGPLEAAPKHLQRSSFADIEL